MIRTLFAGRQVGVVDVALGALLAVVAYGAVAAVAYSLSAPPFAAVFGLARWDVFIFFTVAGMALTGTLLQAPVFLVLTLILRRRGTTGPIRLLAAGAATGAIAAFAMLFPDGVYIAERMGEYTQFLKTSMPVGVALACFTYAVVVLRGRRARARSLRA